LQTSLVDDWCEPGAQEDETAIKENKQAHTTTLERAITRQEAHKRRFDAESEAVKRAIKAMMVRPGVSRSHVLRRRHSFCGRIEGAFPSGRFNFGYWVAVQEGARRRITPVVRV
jgi:hypothetical protein